MYVQLPIASVADQSRNFPRPAVRPREASGSTAKRARQEGPCTRCRRKSPSGVLPCPSILFSTDGAAWLSFSLAECTTTAKRNPNARAITWRFRPVTCLFGSRPRLGPACRSVSTDWVSITAALGLGSRPSATRVQLAESGPSASEAGSDAAISENGSTQSATGESPPGAFATASRSSARRKLHSAGFEDHGCQSGSDQRSIRSVSIPRRSGQRDTDRENSERPSLWIGLADGLVSFTRR